MAWAARFFIRGSLRESFGILAGTRFAVTLDWVNTSRHRACRGRRNHAIKGAANAGQEAKADRLQLVV